MQMLCQPSTEFQPNYQGILIFRIGMEKSEKVAILKGAAGRNVNGLLLVFGITADEVLGQIL